MNNQSTGTVKWFSKVKGYGFIIPDGGEGEIFAHYEHIDDNEAYPGGRKNLYEGDRVSFIAVENGSKGLMATAIKRVRGLV